MSLTPFHLYISTSGSHYAILKSISNVGFKIGDPHDLLEFYQWMVKNGRLDHQDGSPQSGLAPITAKNRLIKVRRILIDLGYIKAICLGYKKRQYSIGRPIESLTVEEFDRWFSSKFPPHLNDIKARQRMSNYIDAIFSFCSFLHYGLGIWDKKTLELLRRTVRRPILPPPWENKVEILEIEKIDRFLGYLKGVSPAHYMMAYLMRYTGMRYIEVINAKANLKTGTFREDFKNILVVIYGKGRGGLSQKRTTPFFEENKQELLSYIEWREKIGIKSDWLFVNQYGKKWSENSGHFNAYLRRHGKKYGFNDEECKLLTSHKIGRHAYGTEQTIKGVPERFICDNMGIRTPKILERYQNASDKIRVEETKKRLLSGSPDCPTDKVLPLDNPGRKLKLLDMLIREKITQDTFLIALRALEG